MPRLRLNSGSGGGALFFAVSHDQPSLVAAGKPKHRNSSAGVLRYSFNQRAACRPIAFERLASYLAAAAVNDATVL
jgi:hypothetical protein